jgi:hypothetical protein
MKKDKWYSAIDLSVGLNILDSLQSKGILDRYKESSDHPPNVGIKFKLRF